jgi:hypothetical protein
MALAERECGLMRWQNLNAELLARSDDSIHRPINRGPRAHCAGPSKDAATLNPITKRRGVPE